MMMLTPEERRKLLEYERMLVSAHGAKCYWEHCVSCTASLSAYEHDRPLCPRCEKRLEDKGVSPTKLQQLKDAAHQLVDMDDDENHIWTTESQKHNVEKARVALRRVRRDSPEDR